MFKNKKDALNQLLNVLDKRVIDNCVILSVSKNGIFYAREIGLNKGFLEGDFLFIEKIKSPINNEVALAVVSETKDYIIINELVESFEVTDDFLFNEIERVYEEKILEDIYQLRAGEGIISIENRDVLLVDESIDTGLRMLCAIKSCISKRVKSINIATPLISTESADILEKLADNLFFVKKVDDFVKTDFYFKEYE